jgi:hypothetical protein
MTLSVKMADALLLLVPSPTDNVNDVAVAPGGNVILNDRM